MSNLINSIVGKNFVEADSILSETVELIMARKLEEAKKMCAAKMTEQQGHVMNRRAAKLRVMDIAELDVSREKPETKDVENRNAESQSWPIGPVDMNYAKDVKKSGETVVNKSTSSTRETVIPKNNLKEEELNESEGYAVKLKNGLSKASNGKTWWHTSKEGARKRNESSHGGEGKVVKVKLEPDQYAYNGHTVKEETEEQLNEARVKIIKARIRGGKIQRRKKVSNVPGMTLRGGKLQRMSPVERRRRKMGARKAKIKRRTTMNRALMKRQRSLRKRKALGL